MRSRPERGGTTARQQVLARRRMALIALSVLAPVSLAFALFTGKTSFLFFNLFIDVVLAGFIAMLLQIKQSQQASPRRWRLEPEDEVRVL